MRDKFILFICLCLFGCGQEATINRDIISIDNQQEIVPVKYSMIEIPMQGTARNYYSIFSILDAQPHDLYVGYDELSHSLQFLNFTEKKHVKTTPLEKEGPDFIDEVEAIHYHSADSIFLTTRDYITLIQPDGSVLDRWGLRDVGNNTADQYIFYGRGSGSLYYDASTRTIFTGIYDITLSEIAKPEGYFKGKLFGKFNIDNPVFEVNPLSYSPEYSADYFGYLGKPTVTHETNGKTYITYPISKSIFSLNREESELTTLQATAHSHEIEDFNHTLAFNQTRDDDAKMKHYMLTTKFGPAVAYNDDIVVRLVRKGLNKSTVDLSDINHKKKVYLIVYDLKNRAYQETELAENFINTDLLFMVDGSLYAQGFAAQEEDCKFLKISL